MSKTITRLMSNKEVNAAVDALKESAPEHVGLQVARNTEFIKVTDKNGKAHFTALKVPNGPWTARFSNQLFVGVN